MIESVQKQLKHSLIVLAVESSHSWDDIEKQYRQLIQRWHPDRNPDENSDTAQTKFIEINTAYKMVKDYYQKNGAIPQTFFTTNNAVPYLAPKPIRTAAEANAHEGPLLGTKKPVKPKTPLHKNILVLCAAIGFMVLISIGIVLWSLDSRLAENNRDRANVEKTDTLRQTHSEKPTAFPPNNQGAIKQSTNDVEQ